MEHVLALEARAHGKFGGDRTGSLPRHNDIVCRLRELGLEVGALLSLFAMDIGWVMLWPTVALVGSFSAFALYLRIVTSSARGYEHRPCDFAHNLAVFGWVVGNTVWMCSEFLWDDDRPEGFADIIQGLKAFTEKNKALFPTVLLVSAIVMWTTSVVLAGFYAKMLHKLWRPRRCRNVVSTGVNSALGDIDIRRNQGYGSAVFCTPPVRDEASTAPRSSPSGACEEFFLLPWLLSDSCWLTSCLRSTVADGVGFWAVAAAIFGFVAIVLAVDEVRCRVAARRWCDAVRGFAELLWLAGNVAWFVTDTRGPETFEERCTFGALFSTGFCFVTCAAIVEARALLEPRVETARLLLTLSTK
eukprot:TRINITY_DN30938_c0_g1_i1.p1 TRINITY_DN30938_c0_g1~~TRINITY_DN30938_c0_g1_i1.p1  ORF type:complete len:358 (-),score=47.27 TRINITY_DN30938_c0_g1_i1:23-1096(-)